ncbi:hypothetical protein ACWD48_19865 [Streptomyces sp. NPDC002519]
MSDRLTPQREAEIAEDLATYHRNHSYPGAFVCCSAHLVADAAQELLAELAAVRAELAHAVPHARELALKDAARWMCESPDAAFERIHQAAQDAQTAANAALDAAEATS